MSDNKFYAWFSKKHKPPSLDEDRAAFFAKVLSMEFGDSVQIDDSISYMLEQSKETIVKQVKRRLCQHATREVDGVYLVWRLKCDCK